MSHGGFGVSDALERVNVSRLLPALDLRLATASPQEHDGTVVVVVAAVDGGRSRRSLRSGDAVRPACLSRRERRVHDDVLPLGGARRRRTGRLAAHDAPSAD